MPRVAEHTLITCPCGTEMDLPVSMAKRKKFCSKACFYVYRAPRPTGLQYEIKVENRAWIKPGQRLSPSTQIKPGERRSPSTEFKPGMVPPNFQGDDVKYGPLHVWVTRHRGRPTACEHCGVMDVRLHWANKSHEYHRDLDDWIGLCPKCHTAYDRDHQGAAQRAGKR